MRTFLKVFAVLFTILLVTGSGLWGCNYVRLQAPVQKVLDADSRNAGIEVRAHYALYIPGDTLVFDLRRVGPDLAPVDVFRVFLQYAQAMKAEQFKRVELAYQGRTKFILGGEDFRQMGVEYGDQNPMYTMRTFPEKLRTAEGLPAFETIEGGALGVLGAQMEQFGEFHRKWYIDAL
jgi:hypothetical protein